MQTIEAANKSGRLSARSKILYGVGDLYGGGAFQLISFFYSIFLSDTLGLNMTYISAVMLIGKIWDSVSDPLMGRITDNTKSRWGRRRPYLLFGSLAVVLSFVFLFTPLSSDSQTLLFAFAIVSYLVFCTVWTIVMVPYFALGAEMTLDYNERTKLVTVRMLFSLTGSLLASALPMTIINSFGNSRDGFFVMSVVFGLIFGIAILSVFFSGKETLRPNIQQERVSFINSFANALKIRSFRIYTGMFIFGVLTVDVVSITMAYYVRYYLRADGVLTLFLTVALLTQLVMLPFWSYIARKFSKRTAYMAGAIIWVIMGLFMFLLKPETPLPIIITVMILNNIGLAAIRFIPQALLGDVTDIGEFANGKREEGTYSGFSTFMRKMTSGIGLAAVTGILGLLGYITPAAGTVKFSFITQPAPVVFAIRLFISIIPVCLTCLGFICAYSYQVSRENHNKIVAHMNDLREGGIGKLSTNEELALKKILISKNIE